MILSEYPRQGMRVRAEQLALSLRDFAQQGARVREVVPSPDCAEIPIGFLIPRRPDRYGYFPRDRKG